MDMCVCVCACLCLCACVRACVCVFMGKCSIAIMQVVNNKKVSNCCLQHLVALTSSQGELESTARSTV